MKSYSDLTIDDLEQIPIWKLADPSKHEVEPWPKKGGAPLLSVVRTESTAADGTTYVGCAILTKINLVSPSVFAAGRRIELFHAVKPAPEWREMAYAALGRTSDAFFPLTIKIAVTSQHRPLPAKLPGFIYRSPDGAFIAVR